MERVFLSFHFDDEASKKVANVVEELLESHGIKALTAETGKLGGGRISDGIEKLIMDSDATICLFTDLKRNINYLRDERSMAKAHGKKFLSIVPREFKPEEDGIYSDYQFIRFGDENSFDAKSLLELSRVIGIWKQENGRFLEAILKPRDVAKICHEDGSKLCYRIWSRGSGDPSEWRSASVQKRGMSETVAFFKNIKDGDRIDVKLKRSEQKWESGACEQFLNIELELSE